MIIDVIGDAIYGKHSEKLNAFEDALKRGDTETCLGILSKDPKFALRVERDVYGHDTPLNMAMRYGNADVCDRLLDLGAKMNVPYRYAGDKQTPMTMVFDPSFRASVPNYQEIQDVLVKHYDDRRQAGKSENLLDDLKNKAAGMFKAFAERLDGMIKEPAIGIAGVGAVGASIGSALGLTAAGALTAAASVPLAVGGASVGLGVTLTHLVRSNLSIDEPLSTMQELATQRFDELANERRKNVERTHDNDTPDRDGGSGGTPSRLGDLKGRAAALFKSVSDQVDVLSQSDHVRIGSFKSFCVAAGLAMAAASMPAQAQAQVIDSPSMRVGVMDQGASLNQQPLKADWHQTVSQRKAQEMAEMQYRNSHVVKEMPATVIKDIAASQAQATDYAMRIGAQVKQIDTAKGRYAGKVVHDVPAHFVQDLGMKTVAIHEKGNFNLNEVGNALNSGKSLRVQYENGRGSINNTQERSKDQGRSL